MKLSPRGQFTAALSMATQHGRLTDDGAQLLLQRFDSLQPPDQHGLVRQLFDESGRTTALLDHVLEGTSRFEGVLPPRVAERFEPPAGAPQHGVLTSSRAAVEITAQSPRVGTFASDAEEMAATLDRTDRSTQSPRSRRAQEQLFADSTLPVADPRWMVNPKPQYHLEGDELVILRQDWELQWPQGVGGTYGLTQLLGEAIEKRFDTPATGMTYGQRGDRSGQLQTRNTLEAVEYSGAHAPRGPAVALHYDPASLYSGFTDYFRFLPPERAGEPPTRVVAMIERDGGLETTFEMQKKTRETRVKLTDSHLKGLSTDDARRMWADASVTHVPAPTDHAGTWEGHPLLDDLTLPGLMHFKHQSWEENGEMVGTFRWRPLFQHGGMRLKRGDDGTKLQFFPLGFHEELRAFNGTPDLMLGRFSFEVKGRDGQKNTEANAFFRLLMQGVAELDRRLETGHYVREEPDGRRFVDFYYVIEKKSDGVDEGEKKVFAGDRQKLVTAFGP